MKGCKQRPDGYAASLMECCAHRCTQGHNEMDTFARIVAASAKSADYTRIAQYYESRGEYDKASGQGIIMTS